MYLRSRNSGFDSGFKFRSWGATSGGRLKKSLWVSFLSTVLILALIGCGGAGSSMSSNTSNSTSTANTFVTGEDAPLPAVLGFNVTISSITLSGNNSASATLLSQPETVDFARLIGLRQLLAFNSVPSGTYNSITFKFSSPIITYLNVGTTPPTTATINGTWASGVTVDSSGVATVTVSLKNPITLDNTGLVGFHMHFDLRNSLAVDGAGQITGQINPQITVNAVHPDDDDAQITDMRGSILSVSASTNSFVIQRWNGKQATIAVNNSTTFNDGNSLSTLTQGMVAEIEGKLQSDGTILASAVEVVTVEHAYVAGPILYVDPNGKNITILAAEEAPAIPGVNLQTPLTLDISTVQRYSIAGIDNWLTSFAFNATTLVAGQHIAVGGTLDNSTNPAKFVPLRIRLMRQGVAGMLVSNSVTIGTGNSGSFQLQNGGLVGYVIGAPLTVKTAPLTRFINVNGLTGLQSAGTAQLEVRGLILKDQTTGQPTLYAHWVRLLP
jgi:Domain of unknown function (DUF5666)/Domain of unknown function (DUF4382)